MKPCTPDTPHDRVDPALALCHGCGRPVVILRRVGGPDDGTTLVSTLTDDGLVGLGLAVVAMAAVLGLTTKLADALRDPGSIQRIDRREEP